MADPALIRLFGLKSFLKARTGLCVGDSTAGGLLERVTAALEALADRARERAESESRTTLPRPVSTVTRPPNRSAARDTAAATSAGSWLSLMTTRT